MGRSPEAGAARVPARSGRSAKPDGISAPVISDRHLERHAHLVAPAPHHAAAAHHELAGSAGRGVFGPGLRGEPVEAFRQSSQAQAAPSDAANTPDRRLRSASTTGPSTRQPAGSGRKDPARRSRGCAGRGRSLPRRTDGRPSRDSSRRAGPRRTGCRGIEFDMPVGDRRDRLAGDAGAVDQAHDRHEVAARAIRIRPDEHRVAGGKGEVAREAPGPKAPARTRIGCWSWGTTRPCASRRGGDRSR